ncbi:hypothetical protein [Mycobacteroides salmoniphilum]|uniref:Serine/arginine repetitive matrix protein 2 n=1 Tax=Mycobacteroides salmoniphilum TaxID=404941 RepID=A0A4R8SKY6_9MYCO|nr:hypothetical protein [Mycobacteroides salmoniphilum]TDZ98353.1 hypothetical protein CCUG60885_00222 [Mycobacteroides salmoniphilum]TEA02883.1 hypothetical protein CCUG60883_03506 [Mycobacteroides salmoniphilum]
MSMPTPRRPLPRYWYGIGAALIAAGVIGGIALFIAGIVSVVQGPTHEFDGNGSATVPFAAGTSQIIYVADVKVGTSVAARTRCVARDENNRDATLRRYGGSMSINRWNALDVVTAQEAGNYTISCAGPADRYYGVGPRASTAAITATIAGPLGGVCLVVAGIIVLIVTASRRRPESPPHPGPPQYPYPHGRW